MYHAFSERFTEANEAVWPPLPLSVFDAEDKVEVELPDAL